MTNQFNPKAIEIAAAHWQPLPEWVRMLAEYCDANTQAAAAKLIRYSASLVNQVLKNRYTGDLEKVKSRVETALKAELVRCPILGTIGGGECVKHQNTPYNPANHQAVALYRQCRRCPNAYANRKSSNAQA